MKRNIIKAMVAAGILTLSVSLPFPAMAAQNFCLTGNRGIVVVNGQGNFVWQSCLPGGNLALGGNSGNCGNGGSVSGNLGGSGGSSLETTDEAISQLLALVNEEREKSGLSPLTLDSAATSAAQVRAQEIVTNFSHTRPNGSSFTTALNEAGVSYRSAGENIAYGQTSAAQVMNSWMNSSGHRANILSKNYTKIGIGHYEDASGTDYWVQIFVGE